MSGDLLDGVSQGWRQTTCRGEEPAPPPRTRLLRLAVGLVEDVRSAPGDRQNGSEGFSADFQLCLPYRGMLVWHVGRDAVVGDANQMLFVTGGEKYRIIQPHQEGYGELIVTPELSVLAEIANSDTDRLPSHPLFRRRSRMASPRLQSFRARFLSWATRASAPGDRGPGIELDELMAEELVVALLRAALTDVQWSSRRSPQLDGSAHPPDKSIPRSRVREPDPPRRRRPGRRRIARVSHPRVPAGRGHVAAPVPHAAPPRPRPRRVAADRRPDGARARNRVLEPQSLHAILPAHVRRHAVSVPADVESGRSASRSGDTGVETPFRRRHTDEVRISSPRGCHDLQVRCVWVSSGEISSRRF